MEEINSLVYYYGLMKNKPITIKDICGDDESDIIYGDFSYIIESNCFDEDNVLTEDMFVEVLEDKLNELSYYVEGDCGV